MLAKRKLQPLHIEVHGALISIGDPALGAAIQKDRGSRLQHLGITFPALRKRVREGFSFYTLPEAHVLEVWDSLWQTSPYGDVLFAALEYYGPIVRKRVSPLLWPVLKQWAARVVNWCHCDGLGQVYARILMNDVALVYPQIVSWNASPSEWLRRQLSILCVAPFLLMMGYWRPH